MALSRYYNPYYNPRAAGAGMAAFMYRQPEEPIQQSGQYYMPDRRRQTNTEYAPPQQNEVFYPLQSEQQPEAPVAFPTEPTELAEPTEKAQTVNTTAKAVVPELTEAEVPEVEEVEEPTPKSKKAVVSRKKQVKRPIDDEEEDDYAPKMPAGAFFPIFFGWGGRSGAGGPGGPTAIANAYSTGRGGVATSHATAYGAPRPDSQYGQEKYRKI